MGENQVNAEEKALVGHSRIRADFQVNGERKMVPSQRKWNQQRPIEVEVHSVRRELTDSVNICGGPTVW